jgi:predicted solute-binding protein
MESVRVAAVGYTNAWPLLTRLDRIRYQVMERHPSEVARLLRDGHADVGLIPAAAMLTDAEYRVVPGWCIGCEGAVHSVLLVAETPPEQWTAVALDGVSRTSAVLSRLLLSKGPLAERTGDLTLFDCDPGTSLQHAQGTVAALVIGDAARSLPERLAHRLDLGALWWEWTQLPFVFAVWAGRPDLPHEAVEGLRLAAGEGMRLRQHLPEPDRTYVMDQIRYELDDRALMGLRRFAALGAEAGLLGRPTDLPNKDRDVEFALYGPPAAMRPRPDVQGLLMAGVQGDVLDESALLQLAEQATLADLCAAADLKRRRMHPEPVGTYAMGARVSVGDRPLEQVFQDLVVLAEDHVAQIHLVDTPDPGRLSELVAHTRQHLAVELFAGELGQVMAGGVQAGLAALSELDGLLPNAGYLLDDGLRRRLADVTGFLPNPQHEIHGLRLAQAAGLLPQVDMRIGHHDGPRLWVRHLLALRELAPAAVCVRTWSPADLGWSDNTAAQLARVTALARLALDTPHLVADPDSHGMGSAQASLHWGCDDLGLILHPETTTRAELHLRELGRTPRRRDSRFKIIGDAVSRPHWSPDRARASAEART